MNVQRGAAVEES